MFAFGEMNIWQNKLIARAEQTYCRSWRQPTNWRMRVRIVRLISETGTAVGLHCKRRTSDTGVSRRLLTLASAAKSELKCQGVQGSARLRGQEDV